MSAEQASTVISDSTLSVLLKAAPVPTPPARPSASVQEFADAVSVWSQGVATQLNAVERRLADLEWWNQALLWGLVIVGIVAVVAVCLAVESGRGDCSPGEQTSPDKGDKGGGRA